MPREWPWVWFLPVIGLLLLVTLYPMVSVFWMSFEKTQYYDTVGFVGLKNYLDVFQSDDFYDRSVASCIYVIGSLAVVLPVGVMAAYVFDELGRIGSLLRVLCLVPWTLSMAVIASIWLWLLNPSYGPVAYLIESIGLRPGLMLGDYDLAIYLMIIATAWWSFPYVVVIMTAVLQSVPRELFEAVDIDGGGAYQKFRHVTWPYIMPALGSTALSLGILYLTLITLIIVLTGGGPLGSTSTWSFEVYKGTVEAVNIAPAAVYSVVIMLANLLLGFAYVRITGRLTA